VADPAGGSQVHFKIDPNASGDSPKKP